ncbi:MAG: FAD-binding and (Fe-S)-binding domain-containing protein [Balneolaceae bacterium]
MSNLIHDLRTRRLYAQDASMYEEVPQAVTFPKGVQDIQAVVRQAAADGLSITPRSAGTSLAGQTTGGGVVMDTSRYMTQILNLDAEARVARVQPGVIRDTLNREAATHHLQFGPDTATTNRCMLGGMIGNNSCGSFSIKHKTTREHILEIEAVLCDGSIARFSPLSDRELEEKCALQTTEGAIYREMVELLQSHKEAILADFPHPDITRRNTGYALDRLCEMSPITPGGRPFNLAELLCGSEGTLAMTASAVVRLVPLPAVNTLVIPQFHSLDEAMRATVDIVKWNPAAVELVDDIILDATKGNIEQNRNRFFLEGDPGCILIVQLEGDDPEALHQQAEDLVAKLRESNLGYAHPILSNPDEMQRVWNLRKAGLGLLMGLGSDSRSPSFVEDTSVRVQDLPQYVEEFQQILKRHNTSCVFYAHASVGELHLRPVIDTTTEKGVQTMKQMAEEVARLVKKYRGSLSGEHGDGRARAPYIETVLGARMMPLLKRVKEIWDPNGLFNPGKIVDPAPIDHGMRFSPAYKRADVPTRFHWRKENGFGAALELCNGAGVCRKLPESGGTMCPSYHATREEMDTTRGRANLFRQLFTGAGVNAFESDDLKAALSLCLSCKACKSECPANVDMARMKAEFTHGWHQANGVSLTDRFFGRPEALYPFASRFPNLVNRINRLSPTKWMLEKTAGVARSRVLPAFASQPFHKWFQSEKSRFQDSTRKPVALLVDIFTNYHDPDIAKSACELLSHLGYSVLVPFVRPTGRPQLSRGLLDEAAEICEENINRWLPFAESNIPIVGLEPSELLTMRDEYPDLCSENQLKKAEKVAANSFLWEEFLQAELAGGEPLSIGKGQKVAIHNHCHSKALTGTEPLLQAFRLMGFEPYELDTGCCGMAGSFGYEASNVDISHTIGEQVLFPALRSLPEGVQLCAPGFSCRHQIRDGVQQTSRHPAQIMAAALRETAQEPTS